MISKREAAAAASSLSHRNAATQRLPFVTANAKRFNNCIDFAQGLWRLSNKIARAFSANEGFWKGVNSRSAGEAPLTERMTTSPNTAIVQKSIEGLGMKPIKLQVVSDKGVEATIFSDGSQGGVGDFYSTVSVNGFMEAQKVYGVDPIQAFALGLKLIEQLTEDKRLGGDADPIEGASWRIEIVKT